MKRLISTQLVSIFDNSNMRRKDFDDVDLFVEMLAVPEVTLVLVMEDYKCSKDQGRQMVWLSEPFGEREYPYNDSCPVMKAVHDQAAATNKMEIAKEAEKGKTRCVSSYSPQGPSSSDLSRGKRRKLPPSNREEVPSKKQAPTKQQEYRLYRLDPSAEESSSIHSSTLATVEPARRSLRVVERASRMTVS